MSNGRLIVITLLASLIISTVLWWFFVHNKPLYTCNNQPVSATDGTLIQPCYTVNGTIVRVFSTSTGDVLVQLRPDPDQTNVLNQANIEGQSGSLLVKLDCQVASLHPTGYSRCAEFSQSLTTAWDNQHISYTGPLITNSQYGWNELIPLGQSL